MSMPEGHWRPYDTVPKDGRAILLWAADAGGPFLMRWHPEDSNPLVSTRKGIWVLEGGGMTWCDEDPDGAPTHWRPLEDA